MSEMFPGKWLKKEDVPHPTTATISRVSREEVNADNGGREMKVVMAFAEPHLKPMILNIGNATAVTELYGDDSANWVGKRVEVYTDPNVMFGGKRVGGLRLRAPSANGHHAAPDRDRFNVLKNSGTPSEADARPAQPAGVVLWDYSDGQNVVTRQTTEQVMDVLTEMFDGGANVDGIRVRPSGTKDTPLVGSAWRKLHGDQTPAPAGGDNFPF